MPKMKWIGLTGGIATGKSTVSRIFESRSYAVIDADHIVHRLLQPGQAPYKKVVDHFGTKILNQSLGIDRRLLGELVFKEPDQRRILESLIHPHVQQDVAEERTELESSGERYAFYDVPLLFENNLLRQFDFVVTVWCDPKQQLARLKQRNQLTEIQAQDRIGSQLPLIEKVKASKYCIDNSGSESELIMIVNGFCDRLDLNQV